MTGLDLTAILCCIFYYEPNKNSTLYHGRGQGSLTDVTSAISTEDNPAAVKPGPNVLPLNTRCNSS